MYIGFAFSNLAELLNNYYSNSYIICKWGNCFFMILIPLVYFSCLIKLARTFRTMLNWCYNSDHISFVLGSKENASNISLLSWWLWILIWYFPFQVLEISFHFWFKSFIWNEYWFLSIFLFLLSYSLWSIDIVGYSNKFANLL